jgi:hypothetical protein
MLKRTLALGVVAAAVLWNTGCACCNKQPPRPTACCPPGAVPAPPPGAVIAPPPSTASFPPAGYPTDYRR